MTKYFCICLAWLAMAQIASAAVTFEVGDYDDPNSSFEATFLHSAYGHGDGPAMSGFVSSKLGGILTGEITGTNNDILRNISGSIEGTADQLGYYSLGWHSSPSDTIEIKFGTSIDNLAGDKNGVLGFALGNPAGFVGGWIDYEMSVTNSSNHETFLNSGTFYFYPKAQTPSTAESSPNNGSIDSQFALWGNNWQYKGVNWNFLTSLETQSGVEAPAIADSTSCYNWWHHKHSKKKKLKPKKAFGIDIFAHTSIDEHDVPNAVPEPATVIVWSFLCAIGFVAYRKYGQLQA